MESLITHETMKTIFQISTYAELVITFRDLLFLHRKLSAGIIDNDVGRIFLKMAIECVNKAKMGPDTNIEQGGPHTAIDQQALVGDICLHFIEKTPSIPLSSFPRTQAGMEKFSGYLFTMGANFIKEHKKEMSSNTRIPMKRVDQQGNPLTVDAKKTAKDGKLYKTGKTRMIPVEHNSIDTPLIDEEGNEEENTLSDSRYAADRVLDQASFDELYEEHYDIIKRKVSGSHGNKHLKLLLDEVYYKKSFRENGVITVQRDSSGLPIAEFAQNLFIDTSEIAFIPIELFGTPMTLAIPAGVDENLVLEFTKLGDGLVINAYHKEVLGDHDRVGRESSF